MLCMVLMPDLYTCIEPSILNLHVCCTRSQWCLLSAPCIVPQTCPRTSLHGTPCERSHWGSSGTPMSRWWGTWRRCTDHSQRAHYKTTDSVSGGLREDILTTPSQRDCYKANLLGQWGTWKRYNFLSQFPKELAINTTTLSVLDFSLKVIFYIEHFKKRKCAIGTHVCQWARKHFSVYYSNGFLD